MKFSFKVFYEGYLERRAEESRKERYAIVLIMADIVKWHYDRKEYNTNPKDFKTVSELVDAYIELTKTTLMKYYGYTDLSFNNTWNTREKFNERVLEFGRDVIFTNLRDVYNIGSFSSKITIYYILNGTIKPTAAFEDWKQVDKEIEKGSKQAGANLDF